MMLEENMQVNKSKIVFNTVRTITREIDRLDSHHQIPSVVTLVTYSQILPKLNSVNGLNMARNKQPQPNALIHLAL